MNDGGQGMGTVQVREALLELLDRGAEADAAGTPPGTAASDRDHGRAGEPGSGPGRSGGPAAALRAALAASRASGLGSLAEAARAAGEWDDTLAAALVRGARPARSLAGLLGGRPRPDGEAAAELRGPVGRYLGGDPARWAGLHDALATARAALPDLLAARPAPADGPGLLPPGSVLETLALLLEHTARPEHAATALTGLPDRAVEGLLGRGTLPGPALSAAVVAHGDTRSRAALARHTRLDARTLKALVGVGDPAVNASVYRNQRCTPSLRRAITHAVHCVPLDPGLRAELESPARDGARALTAPLLGCGDPALAARALRWGVRKAAQRYALLRVWECRGADALHAMLADPATARHVHRGVRDDVTAALGRPDGLARLRAEGEPYDDPEALPRLLATTRGTSTLRDLLNEPYAHDMRALAAANRRSPFMPQAAGELVRHEDATDAERAEFRLTLLNAPWRTGGRIAGNPTPPDRRLAAEPLDESAPEWAVGVVRAGLLDPARLVTTARPAGHAVLALRALAAEGLWTAEPRTAFLALCREALGTRTDAWEALHLSLGTHRGTLEQAIREAARVPAATDPGSAPQPRTATGPTLPLGPAAPHEPPGRQGAPVAPAARPTPRTPVPTAPRAGGERAAAGRAPAPPSGPVGERARSALGAVDLLFSLAPDGAAPLPEDPGVLRYLAAHGEGDAPAWRHPEWLWKACAEQGLYDLVHPCRTPSREEALTSIAAADDTPSAARAAERAYLHGVLDADDLLHHLPADRLLSLPYGWEEHAFTTAWRRALGALLDRELGTDADAWLRLENAARHADGTVAWPALLDRARHGGGRLRSGGGDQDVPADPEAALHLLARGDHLWAWPLGALLCEARPEAVAAVLPRCGPDAPWRLAAYLLRHRAVPEGPFAHLVRSRDPAALRVLTEQSRWLDARAVHRLADLADPDVDLALLRASRDRAVLRRIAGRPGRATARLTAELRAEPLAAPPGGTVWLESAAPDLVELVLTRSGGHLNLAQQLAGCASLLRHGGPGRLAALAGSGVLGATATRLCQKALTSDDPLTPLAARLRREVSADRMVKRLRRARGHWTTREVLAATPCPRDWEWDALEAAHRAEPVPYWEEVVRHPDAPHALRLRHAAHLPDISHQDGPEDRELTLARVRHGLGGHHRQPVDTVLDRLLETGRLTGRDLVHEAAPAAVVLAYLNRARLRRDAPAEVGAALAETERLVRGRLAGDAAAWQRVVARLTERDPRWRPSTPVPDLLSADRRVVEEASTDAE
ncbi:hypothetical protein [Streptomyces fradiae]|uniref:hypothetical protein n=1 Tax=Streptomyces fradiae TaxID=1906 RepID=UPI002942EC60|nr:hypothetical protein [Streptomyces fradiae]WOI60738.1 hypothetical protein RYQ63_13005 [Streptomyces fradiae]